MEGFARLRESLVRELRTYPVQSGIREGASYLADTMISAWTDSGFSYIDMRNSYMANPWYPMDPNDPVVQNGKDWFSVLTAKLPKDGWVDPHGLIMSTLKHFRTEHGGNAFATPGPSNDKILEEEKKRMKDADARTIFFNVSRNARINVQEIYACSSYIALVNLGFSGKLLKVVAYENSREARSDILDRMPKSCIPANNRNFNYERELNREPRQRELTVKNVYMEDLESSRFQISKAFPNAANVQMIPKNNLASVTFKSHSDAVKAFFESGDLKIEGARVTVLFRR